MVSTDEHGFDAVGMGKTPPLLNNLRRTYKATAYSEKRIDRIYAVDGG